MCNKVFNMTQEEDITITHIFSCIYSVGYNNHSCKTPCTTIKFTTELVTKTPASVDFFTISFDPLVSGTQTSFSLSP